MEENVNVDIFKMEQDGTHIYGYTIKDSKGGLICIKGGYNALSEEILIERLTPKIEKDVEKYFNNA